MVFEPGFRGDVEEDSPRVTLDGVLLAPVVYGTEITGTGEMTTYTDQCGYSEAEKLGPGTMTLTVEALLYKPYVQELYRAYEEGDVVEATHPAEIGTLELELQDVTITQEGENNEFVDSDGNARQVFTTQIQLKSPNAETGGGF